MVNYCKVTYTCKTLNTIKAMKNLKSFSEYLRAECLPQLAKEYLDIVLELNIPIVKLVIERKIFPDITGENGIKMTMAGLDKFLASIIDETVFENAKQSLKQWEEGKLPIPGLEKKDIHPSDLVLVYAAQKSALYKFLPAYCKNAQEAVSIMKELEDYYMKVQNQAIQTLFKIQKEIENNLKESEEKFKGLLESAPDAIVISDKDGIIQLANTQTEKIFGYSKQELVGKKVEVLIPGRFQDKHPAHRDNYFKTPKPREMGIGLKLYGKRKDNTEFPVEISLSPLKTNEGILVSAAIRDITKRKIDEEKLKQKTIELERSNNELEQFAYVASHDLQEPLRTISSYVQLLASRYKNKLDKDAMEFIEYTVDGSNRMRELINSLLEYSRINRVKPFEEVNLTDLIEEIMLDMKEQIKSSKAVVKYDDLPVIYCDKTLMGRLFQNLIGNGLKFRGDQKPEIIISALKKNGAYEFSVKDNGIGIKKEYWDKIFVIFQRLNNRETYPGTGIGLSICKKIVEKHGGEIWVDSEPGKGSTFHFTIKQLTNKQEPMPVLENAK